jgi:hypothetical protein
VIRFYVRRLAIYNRRSRSRLRQPEGASTKICSMPGKLPLTMSPKVLVSVGTILQPTKVSVSRANYSSRIFLLAFA